MFEAAGPVRAQFLLGKAYYEATLFPQAEESFLEALRLDPRFPGVRLELGKVYISLRRTDEAIRELELALKDSPGDGDASYFLGGLLVQEDRLRRAFPTSSGQNRRSRTSGLPYFYLGKAKLRLEQPAAGCSAAATSRGVESRRRVCVLPARAGAPGLRTGIGSPPRASSGPRFERRRAPGRARWACRRRPLSLAPDSGEL